MKPKLTHLDRIARARASGQLAVGLWMTTVEHKPGCRHVDKPLKCRCVPLILARCTTSGQVVEIGRNGEVKNNGRAH